MKAILPQLALILVLLFIADGLKAQTPDANNIIYVDANATGTGNGSSWLNAMTSLADALKYAQENRTSYTSGNTLKIYVAKGVYKPAYSPASFIAAGRQNTFLMVANVQLYGGFDSVNGIDDLADTRIYGAGGTILSGDVNGDDIATGSGSTLAITQVTENNHHVVVAAGEVGAAVLDGFTVTGGNADNSASYVTANGAYNISVGEGGGMYILSSSPQLVNCTFTLNRGYWYAGGIFCAASSSPIITGCTVSRNLVGGLGGGMYNSASSPTLTNCTFSGNSSPGSYAGGMANYDNATPTFNGCLFTGNFGIQSGGVRNVGSSTVFTDCRFVSNSATSEGGGVHNIGATSIFTNCSFTTNTAGEGAGIYNSSSSQTMIGCVFTGNSSSSAGAAIMDFIAQSTLINVTTARNGANALYLYSGVVQLR